MTTQDTGKKPSGTHPGTRSLKGVLASKKGKKMSFREIREAATRNALERARKR